MSDWRSGYRADIDYTYYYHQELNPLRSSLGLLFNGLHCPKVKTACELGFGQGLSLVSHAAASSIDWWGTDFNPTQAGFAKELSDSADIGAQIFDESFDEFCSREDLPDFDYIGLHGIWSWISDENRSLIVDFVRRKLRVGGVLYLSYNTLPGWSNFAPARFLMNQHTETVGTSGQGILHGMKEAVTFVDKLLDISPHFNKANPSVVGRLKRISDGNLNYAAHEYFNDHWHPMYFSSVADALSGAKLGFASSAFFLDYFDGINFSAAQKTVLAGIPDNTFKQTVRDFIVNQQFRRDYWLKGPRNTTALERVTALASKSIILTTPIEDISLRAEGAQKNFSLNREVYDPLLEILSDHKVISIGSLHEKANNGSDEFTFGAVLEAIMILAGSNHISPAQDTKDINEARPRTDRLNRVLMRKSHGEEELIFLVSPVTGGGIPVRRFHQFFLEAYVKGMKTPAEQARFAWDILKSQSQGVVKDGQALSTEHENLKELNAIALEFGEKKLNLLKALEIAH